MREPELLTVGVMARRLGVPLRLVVRTLEREGIEPAARAGTLRVYRPQVLELLRERLRTK